jgi:hypothetical protein
MGYFDWMPEAFAQRLTEPEDQLSEISWEDSIRKYAKPQIENWHTAQIYPVVAFHPDYMNRPELIGAALVGKPRNPESSAVVLYSLEDEVSDDLCEFLDTIMELNDGLDTACEIMLAYHRAIIPVKGETLDNWIEIFEDVARGRRSTNLPKLSVWKPEKTQISRTTLDGFVSDLLRGFGEEMANQILDKLMPEFDESFKEEWA